MRRTHAGTSSGDSAGPARARRGAERDALQLRMGQLRGIFETASEGIVTTDESQQIVMANLAAARMFRCSVDDLIGAPLARLIPERFRSRHQQQVADFGAAESPSRHMGHQTEVLGLRADGQEFVLEAGISHVHVDGMRLFTVILRDLTEPRRVAVALRTSELLLSAMFNVSTVGMVQIDASTRRFIVVNPAFCDMTGFEADELVGAPVERVNHPDDPFDGASFQDVLRKGFINGHLRRFRRKDGAEVWVELSGNVLAATAGEPPRVVVVVQDVTARRVAEQTLRAREARLGFLVELNDRLRGQVDARAIALQASRLLADFVSADRVGYAEDDGNGDTVTVAADHTRGAPSIEGRYHYADYGETLIQALRQGRTVVRPDITADPTLSPEEKAAHATLGLGATVNVPLLGQGQLQAIFFVHAARARDWRPDEVALFEDVAQRIRADVERARAEAALRRREARQAFLVRMNDRLRVLDDPQAIAFEAACLLGDHLGAARVGYAEDDGNGQSLTVRRGYARGVAPIEGRHRYDEFGPELLGLYRSGKVRVRNVLADDPGLADSTRARFAALQIGAAVLVPLLGGNGLQALLFVHAVMPRAWTADEVALIADVAQRVRADLERTRAEASLRAAKAQLEATIESMGDSVVTCDAEGHVLELNSAFASIHRFGSKDQCLRTLAEYPDILEVSGPDGSVLPLEQWPVPRALRGESGTNVEYGLRRKDTGDSWTGSYSFAPIRDERGAVAGSVLVGRDVTELKRIHAELQASHRALQGLIAAQDQVQEQERARIARELHDELQQGLAAIAMQAAAARQRLHRPDSPADRSLAGIGRIAAEVIAATRRIVHDLRPQILEDLGLPAALEALAARFTQSQGVACTVETGDLAAAAADHLATVAPCLYRVAQEALNNVGKHAAARSVHVALQPAEPGWLRLVIADDGVGMPAPARGTGGHFGLLGMRERLRAAGGRLHVHSQPGAGTTIEATVPLDGVRGS